MFNQAFLSNLSVLSVRSILLLIFSIQWMSGFTLGSDKVISKTAAVQSTPDTSYAMEAQMKIAMAFIRDDDAANAQTAVRKLLADYPGNPELPKRARKVAYTYFKTEQCDKAKALCLTVLNNWPDCPEAHILRRDLAINHIRLHEYQEAESVTSQLIADYASDPEIGNSIGRIASYYFKPKKPEKAKELCQYALSNWPNHSEAAKTQHVLACSLVKLGEYEQADSATETLLSDYSNHPEIGDYIRKIAYYYLYYDKPKKAIELYQTVIQKWPQTEDIVLAHAGLAAAYLKLGDFSSAEASAVNLIGYLKEDKEYADTVNWLADQYFRNGEYSKAVELYQLVISTDTVLKDKLNAYGGLAKLYARTGEDEVSQELMNQLYESASTKNSEITALYTFEVGEQFYMRGETFRSEGSAEANTDFQKAITYWQEHMNQAAGSEYQGMMYFFSGVAYSHLGEHERAIDCFRTVDTKWPNSEYRLQALSMMAECYSILKDEQAIPINTANREMSEIYTKIKNEYPDSPMFQIAKNWLDRPVRENKRINRAMGKDITK